MNFTTIERPVDPDVQWVGVREYAELTRDSIWAVYRLLKAGKIPGAERPRPNASYRIPVKVIG